MNWKGIKLLGEYKYDLITAALGILLGVSFCNALAQGPSFGYNCDTSAIAGDNSVTLVDIKYNFPEAGQSTWFYRVDCQSTDNFIRRFQFRLGTDCHYIKDPSTRMGTWDLVTGAMTPGAGKPKTKFNTKRGYQKAMFNEKFTDNGSRGYYITYEYNYTVGQVSATIFKGSKDPIFGWAEGDKVTADICGPDTTCTIVCTDICAPPRRISAVMESDTSVVVSWDKISCHKSYKLCGFSDDGSVAGCRQVTGGSSRFKLLEEGKTYHIYMRSNCKSIGNSDWSDTVTIVAQAGNIAERAADPNYVSTPENIETLRKMSVAEGTVRLYPNPVVNSLRVYTKGGVSNWRIIGSTGALIKSGVTGMNEQTFELDLSSFPNGIYFFEMENESGKVTENFLISR